MCLATVSDTVLVLLSAVSKSVGSFPAPLKLPLNPLASGRVLGPCMGPLVKSCVQETGTSQKNEVDGWALGVLLCSLSCQPGVGVFSVSLSVLTAQLSFLQPSMQPVPKKAISICVHCERFWSISWCWSSCLSLMTWRWPA